MVTRIFRKLAIASLAMTAFATANAAPIVFDLAGAPASSVSVNSSCNLLCGISASLDSNLDSVTGSLEVGESFRFDFLDLEFWGIGKGSGTIVAELAFDLPTGAPNATGTGQGGFGTFLGWITGGSLTWDPFSPITLADGTSFLVTFDNLSGIDVGSVKVGGTISLLSGPGGSVSVPEPTTLGLFGLGILAMGFATRRRRVQ